MPSTFEGALPLDVYADDAGHVCLRQVSTEGEEQTITLGLEQSEHLANWIIQYAKSAVEDLMDD